MPFRVAAFYRFVRLDDADVIADALRAVCTVQAIRGTILVAVEGINGTVAGTEDGIAALLAALHDQPGLAGRLTDMEVKLSTAEAMPFRRLKVRVKTEIAVLGAAINPACATGTPVEPEDWNALIADPEVLVIDTRNRFEVAMGSFDGALDPETRKFSQFPDYVRRSLDPARHRKIAMFCTGGIRCEKASAFLLSQGFPAVYQLRGGILGYLERVPVEESRWRGECFVFDERVALGHGLVERMKPQEDPSSEAGGSRR